MLGSVGNKNAIKKIKKNDLILRNSETVYNLKEYVKKKITR